MKNQTDVPFYLSLKVNSSPWLGGTTKLRILQEERARIQCAIDTFRYETNSGRKSMDKQKKMELVTPETPETEPEQWTGQFGIMATQCCGLHSVTGFQYHNQGLAYPDAPRGKNPTPTLPISLKAFVKAIEAAYKKQQETNKKVALENHRALVLWTTKYRNKEAPEPFRYPHVDYVAKPERIPAMLLFTWNNKSLYEPGARILAEAIAKHNLGKCTITDYARNPNSGNDVAAMIWSIDITAYEKYVKENKL